MKNISSISFLLIWGLILLAGCRTDQPLFAGAVYTGGAAVILGIIGIIYVMKKIL